MKKKKNCPCLRYHVSSSPIIVYVIIIIIIIIMIPVSSLRSLLMTRIIRDSIPLLCTCEVRNEERMGRQEIHVGVPLVKRWCRVPAQPNHQHHHHRRRRRHHHPLRTKKQLGWGVFLRTTFSVCNAHRRAVLPSCYRYSFHAFFRPIRP